MIYFLASILVLTLVFTFLHRIKLINVCPVCAAVVITWVVGTISIYTNQSWANPLIIAILLGATLGAVAEKYGSRLGLLWKTCVVLLGLPAIYYIVIDKVWFALGLILLLIILTYIVRKKENYHKHQNKDIFKDCC